MSPCPKPKRVQGAQGNSNIHIQTSSLLRLRRDTSRWQVPLGRASWWQCLQGQHVLVKLEQGGVPGAAEGSRGSATSFPTEEKGHLLPPWPHGCSCACCVFVPGAGAGHTHILPWPLWASGQRAILTSDAQTRLRVEMLSKHI